MLVNKEISTISILVVGKNIYNILEMKKDFSYFSNIKIFNDVSNKKKIIEKIKYENPQIIITYPNINLIKLIRTVSSEIKIIILADLSYNDELGKLQRGKSIITSFKLGVNAYCSKNIEIDKLMKIIEIVENGAYWLDENAGELLMSVLKKDKFQKNMYNLTKREFEVLKLIANGCSNIQIANHLTVSIHTAKAHVCSILQKLEAKDRVQAALIAIKSGWV